MQIADLLNAEHIWIDVDNEIGSKKRALETLSDMLAQPADTASADLIFDKLIDRERLGSTGLGHGVALPHARLATGNDARGALIKLSQGIDFDAADHQPVDLLFALLVPESFTDEHLQILAKLAGLFSDQDLCLQLRQADSPEAIYQRLISWPINHD